MWTARDKDKSLFLFNSKPIKREDQFYNTDSKEVFSADYYDYKWNYATKIEYYCIELNKELYPEVTWENSPIELVLNL